MEQVDEEEEEERGGGGGGGGEEEEEEEARVNVEGCKRRAAARPHRLRQNDGVLEELLRDGTPQILGRLRGRAPPRERAVPDMLAASQECRCRLTQATTGVLRARVEPLQPRDARLDTIACEVSVNRHLTAVGNEMRHLCVRRGGERRLTFV